MTLTLKSFKFTAVDQNNIRAIRDWLEADRKEPVTETDVIRFLLKKEAEKISRKNSKKA